jgi:LPS-assembly protein
MNDVDYINLASNNTENTVTATQILSRINMFYNADQNYFGAYMKYYQDLTVENNDNTIQQVPMLQYHKEHSEVPYIR